MAVDDAVVGIVGLGEKGHRHASAVTELGYEVTGADPRAECREEFGNEFDCRTYESPQELCAGRADVLVVVPPTRVRENATIEALDAGLPVLSEKPIAHDFAAAKRIAQRVEETGTTFMYSSYDRYRDKCRLVRWYIDQGLLGEVTHIEARHTRRRGIPGRGTWFTSEGMAGGGALMDIGIGVLELVLHFYSWPTVDDVNGITRAEFGNSEDYAYMSMFGEDAGPDMFDVEDSATAMLDMSGDRTATVEVAWASNTKRNRTHEYLIRGTDAGLYLNIPEEPAAESKLELYRTRGEPMAHHLTTCIETGESFYSDDYSEEFRNRGTKDAFKIQFLEFLDWVEESEQPTEGNVENAVQVQDVVQSIYEGE